MAKIKFIFSTTHQKPDRYGNTAAAISVTQTSTGATVHGLIACANNLRGALVPLGLWGTANYYSCERTLGRKQFNYLYKGTPWIYGVGEDIAKFITDGLKKANRERLKAKRELVMLSKNLPKS